MKIRDPVERVCTLLKVLVLLQGLNLFVSLTLLLK